MAPALRYPAVTTLAIGLGGTGVRVLRHARQLAASVADLDGKLVAYLGIDTEPGRADLVDELAPLDDHLLLTLDAIEVRRLALRLAEQGERRGVWPEIEDWLTPGLRLIDDLAPMGDALLRPLGRLVFWRYRDLVRGHIARALQAQQLERGPGRLEGARRVMVVASAGGGTGSGLLGDVVDMLRGYEDILELVVVLVIPPASSGASRDDAGQVDARTPKRRRARANAYACLKEHYHLKTGHVRWQGAADRYTKRARSTRWCERLYLSADATGQSAARLIAFQQVRAGQCFQGAVADRKTNAVALACGGAMPERVFSAAEALWVDLSPYDGLRDELTPEARTPAPPGAGDPGAVSAVVQGQPAFAELDVVRQGLRDRLAELASTDGRAADGLLFAALLDDVLLAPPEPGKARWESLVSATLSKVDELARHPGARVWLDQHGSADTEAALAPLIDGWRSTSEFYAAESRRSWPLRALTGLLRGERERHRRRMGLAFLRNALDTSSGSAGAFVDRVLACLLRARPAPAAPEASAPQAPPAPSLDRDALRAALSDAIEQALENCRPRVFELHGPDAERQVTCIALLPSRWSEARRLLDDRVPELLGCQVEIHEHSGQLLWLYFEDPFRAPRDVIGLEQWLADFKAEGCPDILHVDRRFLAAPAFTEIGAPDSREARCGNEGCEERLPPDVRRGHCPTCQRWIRSRCGNSDCALDELHKHEGRLARTCPRCGGINQAAWWPCPRHGKVEHLVPIDKPRCPACVERHLDDPARYPEECIGRRPDLGLRHACPGCVTRREQDPDHASLMIASDLWPYVLDGVNGHDGERFREAAARHELRDGYRCPRCRGFLIPVHHAAWTSNGAVKCTGPTPPGLVAPPGPPEAGAPFVRQPHEHGADVATPS
jgi:hypothetical protein